MSIEKVTLPTQGLLGYESDIRVKAMKGKHLSTILSSLDTGAIDTVIEDIIEPKISINQLTDEDKTFILHKTRELTFGTRIEQTIKCPICGETHDYELDYEDFETTYLKEEDIDKVYEYIHNEETISIVSQVPTGDTWEEVESYKRRYNPVPTLSYIMVQAAHIKTIGGRAMTMNEKVNFLADVMPANKLVELTKVLDIKYGFDPTYVIECKKCGTAFTGGLAITANLFR